MNVARGLKWICLVALCATSAAAAQSFPVRPVRILVPISTGSVTDLLARTVGEKLTEGWGQQVVVENRPGAASVVGTGIAAMAAPDGYTLLMVSNGHAVVGSLYSKLPFDPIKDFSGITRVASVTLVLVTPATLPAATLKEFIALARAKPARSTTLPPGSAARPTCRRNCSRAWRRSISCTSRTRACRRL